MREKMVLYFPESVVEHPLTYSLIKDFNLMVNILKANINPKMEGRIVAEISGDKDDFRAGLDFLHSRGVKTLPLEQEIIWVEERCTHCGACSVICPAGALVMERPAMLVHFDGEKCIICEHCITACPSRAMEVRY
ncbi:MAG TPA: 4Fe-4S binding protein [Firmicutes bacterium]|nr:4Fe-4S binding protein [Bacillota bacterium]